jgi:hypothetical protein
MGFCERERSLETLVFVLFLTQPKQSIRYQTILQITLGHSPTRLLRTSTFPHCLHPQGQKRHHLASKVPLLDRPSHTHIMSNSSPAPRFGTPGGSSSSALLLGRQFKQMQSDKDIPGISCGLVNNSVFEWEVMLMLPDESGGLYGGGCFRSLLHFPSEYPHMPPKMKFVTPIWHPNSESCFPFYLFGLLLTVIFQSTRAAKSASPSCILQKKTSTATNPPPSAGPPSRPPRPSCSPSSACSHHPTTNHPQTSRPASNGARTRLLLKRRSESASETLRKVLGISLCPTIDNQAAYTVSLALNGFLFLFILKVHWRGSCYFLFYLHQYTYRTSGLICSATRDFTM